MVNSCSKILLSFLVLGIHCLMSVENSVCISLHQTVWSTLLLFPPLLPSLKVERNQNKTPFWVPGGESGSWIYPSHLFMFTLNLKCEFPKMYFAKCLRSIKSNITLHYITLHCNMLPFLYLAGIVIFLKVQRLVIVSQSAHILRTLKVLNLDLPSPAINSNWNIKSWNSFIKFNNVHQLQPLFYRNIETSFIFQNVFMISRYF